MTAARHAVDGPDPRHPIVPATAATTAPRRRRGRPRREDGPVVTEEAIVDVALRAIQDNGLSGLALREVARRLGVSLPAVQRHFPTKDDLWRACIDRVTDEIVPSRLGDAPRPEAAGSTVRAHLRSQLERSTRIPGLTAAMLHDNQPGAEARRAYLLERIRPTLQAARARIDAAITAGVVRPVDPDVVLALIGIGLSTLANSGPALAQLFGLDISERDTQEHVASTLADVLLFGLLAERGPETECSTGDAGSTGPTPGGSAEAVGR